MDFILLSKEQSYHVHLLTQLKIIPYQYSTMMSPKYILENTHVLIQVSCNENVWGSRGIAPQYMKMSGQLHISAALPLEKDPMVCAGQEAGSAPGVIWTQWQRNNLCPCWELNKSVFLKMVPRRSSDK
jgi:hypothetical protein